MRIKQLEPRKVDNLTLIDGKTFSATNVAGDIYPPGSPDVGFFHDDTRFLSHLELRIGGHRGVVLSASTEKTFAAQIELTTGNITLRDSFDLPENTVHIRREQLLASEIFFDRLSFENFNLVHVDFTLELQFDADFVDVFQVRGVAQAEAWAVLTRPWSNATRSLFVYRGLDHVTRQTHIKFLPAPDDIKDRVARWQLHLEPLKRVEFEVQITPHVEGRASRAQNFDFAAQLRQRRSAFARWEEDSTHFELVERNLRRLAGHWLPATSMLCRFPMGSEHIIAAGIPWFATIFGRDSIIAAYQSHFAESATRG